MSSNHRAGVAWPATPPPRRRAFRLTIRLKLFLAFALLAIVGASGGVLSVVDLRDLARRYWANQREIASHEAVHDDRIALLSLLDVATRFSQRRDPALTRATQQRLEQLDAGAASCDACHRDARDHAQYDLRLAALHERLAPFLDPRPGTAANPATLLPAIEEILRDLEATRGQMEDRYHQVLEGRRETGRTILRPSVRQHFVLVLGTLGAALLLALAMARAMSRPILPLIAAARRMGSGNPAAEELPGDPDLARVAAALNEMASKVANQAREDTRRQLLDRFISSQEDERKRIARELHDELGQSLSALLMEIRSEGPEGARAHANLESTVSRLLDEVHRMAWDLRPSLLDDLGLQSALSRYAEETSRRTAMPVDFQAVGLAPGQPRLPAHIETVLYRIAQEALNNVARHAGARRASVVLVRRRHAVALLVEDDGQGFDVETVRRERASLGILGMEERVALAGGALTIASAPGAGTSVRAQVPLEAGAP